jgi:hypothetical protein
VNTATVATNGVTLLIYGASLILVIWCIVDLTKRPQDKLRRAKTTVWVAASLLGWLLFGIIGAAIAAFYLVGPRRKMNAQRW